MIHDGDGLVSISWFQVTSLLYIIYLLPVTLYYFSALEVMILVEVIAEERLNTIRKILNDQHNALIKSKQDRQRYDSNN